MGYMDVLYGIDNPLFLDLKSNPKYVFETILPWSLRYALTAPKIARLQGPVEQHLARLSTNQALIDMIAQHFFQGTPASFALSYFSLYLDYRYPRGGTGALSQALERFVLDHGGEIRRETEITNLEPGRSQVTDARGNVYRYKKLVWAADQKTLYRLVDLASLTDRKVIEGIQARTAALVGKIGGDSVLTLYLAVDLGSTYFARISSPHFFYTPSTAGLSQVSLAQLRTDDPQIPAQLTTDKACIEDWLRRYLEHTTYEISCPALRDQRPCPRGQDRAHRQLAVRLFPDEAHRGPGMVWRVQEARGGPHDPGAGRQYLPGAQGRDHRQLHVNAAHPGEDCRELRWRNHRVGLHQ